MRLHECVEWIIEEYKRTGKGFFNLATTEMYEDGVAWAFSGFGTGALYLLERQHRSDLWVGRSVIPTVEAEHFLSDRWFVFNEANEQVYPITPPLMPEIVVKERPHTVEIDGVRYVKEEDLLDIISEAIWVNRGKL